MPKLEKHKHLNAVIQHVPNPPKKTLVESLWNAFEQIHQHKIAIGDVSINNVMVDNDSHECILIDCDSFVVEIDGTVRKPLGQTPGHWYKHLDNMHTIQDFQVNDLFGLAAIIFVILCGQDFHLDINNIITEAGIERRIQDRLFPVCTNPHNCNADTVMRFGQLDEDIRHLFIRTFTQHEPASLEEWKAVIEKIT